jgi:protein SCO1/2
VPARARLALLVALAVLCIGVAAVVGLARGGSEDGSGLAPGVQAPSTGFRGAVRPSGIPPARFSLPDEDGRSVDARRLRGRVVALMFVYSTCVDTCPVTAQQVRGAISDVDRPDVRGLAVSVDPAGDTRAHVRSFLLEQHIFGQIPYLVGTRRQLQGVWRAFGVQPQEKGREHAVSVVVLDRRGRQRIGFTASTLTVDALAHDIRRLAAGA